MVGVLEKTSDTLEKKCQEHKQITISPSVELCSKIEMLKKHFSFRNKQIVIETAVSRYYENHKREMFGRDPSEIAESVAEDEGR